MNDILYFLANISLVLLLFSFCLFLIYSILNIYNLSKTKMVPKKDYSIFDVLFVFDYILFFVLKDFLLFDIKEILNFVSLTYFFFSIIKFRLIRILEEKTKNT